MAPQDISKLIVRTSMKDRAAFDPLYRQTSAKLFGVCLRVLRDRGDAEEALQEVFVKIWTKADRFAVSDLSPISWLVAVARNHAIDRIRARRGNSAAIAALAIHVALPYVSPPAPQPQTRLVASLASDDSDVKYLAVYDAGRREVGLSLVSGERAAGKDFELWMIEGKNAPVSMGVIPAGRTARMAVTPAVQRKLAQGAVLAVSLEPSGGSPTGQPTGPVVAAGDLKGI